MIGFFKKRKLRKLLKEYLHAARHARHMREDIADPGDLEELIRAEEAVRSMALAGEGNIEKAVEALDAATNRIYPSTCRTGVRENVEVLIVAIGAAMAIRAFFFQPFKIPTGSMQPTLNGITTEAQSGAELTDRQPIKFVKWLATGASYKEYRAKTSGRLKPVRRSDGSWDSRAARYGDKVVINIGGTLHEFPVYMADQLRLKEQYEEGEIIVSARVIAGDHILVNKMKYNFMKPERGDISVFDTRSIRHEQVRKDTFYIKRMVGLPNERIQIRNGRIIADGEIISEPPVFEKIATDPAYHGGHGNDGMLESAEAYIQLGEDQYLMCGDNTEPGMSLDGRFFGGVPRADFQGPAMFVYWPVRDHWGIVH